MPTEVPVHLAADGKTEHMRLWALVNAETNADLRRIALSLWLDTRERQAGAGFKAVAAVWVGGKRLQPSKAEIEEHKARPVKKSSELGISEIPSMSADSCTELSPSTSPMGTKPTTPQHRAPSLKELMSGDLDFE